MKCRIVWDVFDGMWCHTRMRWPAYIVHAHVVCDVCIIAYVWIVYICVCVCVSMLLVQGSLTAFFYATQNSHIDTMRVLVNEFKCSPDARGDVSGKVVCIWDFYHKGWIHIAPRVNLNNLMTSFHARLYIHTYVGVWASFCWGVCVGCLECQLLFSVGLLLLLINLGVSGV